MPQVLRVLVVGDWKSGKSQLIAKMSGKEFNNSYKETVGMDFVDLPIQNNIRPQVWNTPRIEKLLSFHNKVTESFYMKLNLIICCIDSSLSWDVSKIEQELAKIKKLSPNAEILVVATKSDRLKNNSVPKFIELCGEERVVITTSAKEDIGVTELLSFLTGLANVVYPKRKEKYVEMRQQLVAAFDRLSEEDIKNNAHDKLEDLERKLSNTRNNHHDKAQALYEFNNFCESILKDHPSTLKVVLEIIAIIALPILVGIIGFGVGFALGLWSGPGAFVSGLVAGQTAALAVAGVTGASTLVSGGLAYGLFKPVGTPTVLTDFDAVAHEEFHLKAAAPAA